MSTEPDPAAKVRRTLALRAEHGTAVHDFDDAVVAAVLDELEQLRAGARPADADPEYARWLTRNLHAAFDAGWATHADLVTGTLATLGADKRRQCGKAWVADRLADLTADEPIMCICGCPLGQPCGCDEDVDHDPASLDTAHETGLTWAGDPEVTF